MTTVVLFTRDLRVRDHPALAAACREGDVVPLFVLDPRLLDASANRTAFLVDSLASLRADLRERGGDLVLRTGEPVAEALSVAAEVRADRIVASADVSAYAGRREARLASAEVAFERYPGVTVVPPRELRPTGGDHYRMFTPYWRAWEHATWRSVEPAPSRLQLPSGLAVGRLPARPTDVSPDLPRGGEDVGQRLLARVSPGDRDALAADETTRLSPYLHFGCVSPLAVATQVRGTADEVVRQLCWRDFFHQVTAAFPAIATKDYRPGRRRWVSGLDDAIEAWRQGRTGVPIVDAGMRQLLAEGWMHNRARMVVASFLTKQLGVDWRIGAAHFMRWLVDGDLANNYGNWQWVAGTGNDTRPNRVLNPLRQAYRFDPTGDYVRRYVPELADVAGKAVHEPWKLERQPPDYPPPLIDPVPARQ